MTVSDHHRLRARDLLRTFILLVGLGGLNALAWMIWGEDVTFAALVAFGVSLSDIGQLLHHAFFAALTFGFWHFRQTRVKPLELTFALASFAFIAQLLGSLFFEGTGSFINFVANESAVILTAWAIAHWSGRSRKHNTPYRRARYL